jgi:hypothetical protein
MNYTFHRLNVSDVLNLHCKVTNNRIIYIYNGMLIFYIITTFIPKLRGFVFYLLVAVFKTMCNFALPLPSAIQLTFENVLINQSHAREQIGIY